MLRSEVVLGVSLYFRKDNIRQTLNKLGEESILMLEPYSEKIESQMKEELEKVEQQIKYLQDTVAETSTDKITEKGKKELVCSFERTAAEVVEACGKLNILTNSIANLQREVNEKEEEYRVSREIRKITRKNGVKMLIGTVGEAEKSIRIKQLLRKRLRRNVMVRRISVYMKSEKRKKMLLIICTAIPSSLLLVKDVITANGQSVRMGVSRPKRLKREIRKLKRKEKRMRRELRRLAAEIADEIPGWRETTWKERCTSVAMSHLKDGGRYLLGRGWVQASRVEQLRTLSGNQTEYFVFEVERRSETPPTSIKETTVSSAFQSLTNVFGIPKHNEINPAPFLMFTLPFLFGAMFGDILHGFLLILISLFLIIRFQILNGKCGVFQPIVDGRYVVLFCGLAACWFGLLYGDLGSRPLFFFQSRYSTEGVRISTDPYPFGLDPIWHRADNRMIFVNNLKMKLSLIIGFAHMGLGSVLSLLNAVYSHDKITLFCLAVPQAISFFLFLGYLVFLCCYKWLFTHTYPSIINTLIGMYTEPFNIQEQAYPFQLYVQLFILSALLISIPWMFLSKPIYLIAKRQVKKNELLDLWISSGIHLVEFGLGLISNTCSYLRLWAVSLAHVQLTSVLHEFTIGNGRILVSILTFPIYMFGTLTLLIGLEGLSATLHALRLNWIEFFSKFYSGTGRLFQPFNFELSVD